MTGSTLMWHVFPWERLQDETKYAKQVTDYLGISHTFMNIDSAVSEREFLLPALLF